MFNLYVIIIWLLTFFLIVILSSSLQYQDILNVLGLREKVEGLAFDGQAIWVVNDNDGTKNSYGETLLLKVENFFPYNTREQEGEAQP